MMHDGEHDPEGPESPAIPGLFDPRPIPAGPDLPDLEPPASDSNESPDIDPPSWDEAEPGEAGRGLIDPRPELPEPEGL